MKLVRCENSLCQKIATADPNYGNPPAFWLTLKGSRADQHFCSMACLVATSSLVDDAERDLKNEARLRDKDRAGL